MTKEELIAQSTKKIQQGDVLLRLLPAKPEVEMTLKKDKILVSSSHNHYINGGSVFTTDNDLVFVETKEKAAVTHQDDGHKAITLEKGWWFVDRVVEVGMFNDMVAPVQD